MVFGVGHDRFKGLSCLIGVKKIVLAQSLSDDRMAREAFLEYFNSLILRHKVPSNRADAEQFSEVGHMRVTVLCRYEMCCHSFIKIFPCVRTHSAILGADLGKDVPDAHQGEPFYRVLHDLTDNQAQALNDRRFEGLFVRDC